MAINKSAPSLSRIFGYGGLFALTVAAALMSTMFFIPAVYSAVLAFKVLGFSLGALELSFGLSIAAAGGLAALGSFVTFMGTYGVGKLARVVFDAVASLFSSSSNADKLLNGEVELSDEEENEENKYQELESNQSIKDNNQSDNNTNSNESSDYAPLINDQTPTNNNIKQTGNDSRLSQNSIFLQQQPNNEGSNENIVTIDEQQINQDDLKTNHVDGDNPNNNLSPN